MMQKKMGEMILYYNDYQYMMILYYRIPYGYDHYDSIWRPFGASFRQLAHKTDVSMRDDRCHDSMKLLSDGVSINGGTQNGWFIMENPITNIKQ